ncbi:MAG: hypothetical protein D4Q77_02330 [Methanothrix sp.]|nr:MAG: hypothetical protein D4Q77_02330 [Methanothrix sp.]
MTTARIFFVIILLPLMTCQAALCDSFVTLAYDDGEAEDGLWIDDMRGHSVLFTAPCDNWTFSGVAVYGKLSPESRSDIFVLEVWDEDLNLVSKVTDRAVSFFGDEFDWALVDIPDVEVSGDFFVSFYEFAGVYVGMDLDSGPGMSLIAARNPNRILEWDVEAHRENQTNWMIRAAGYSPAPDVDLSVLSGNASRDRPAVVDLKIRDPDRNLKSALLYVVNNGSREVVWSDIRGLDGGDAEVRFSWPGTIFQVSDDRSSTAPVLAVDTAGLPENVSSYLARYATCALQLREGDPLITAFAYFGDDGKFNALTDVLGRVHYQSRAVLNMTSHDVDYMDYIANNITLQKDDSMMAFYRVVVPSGTQEPYQMYHQPFLLSRSPLFNYRLELEELDADQGAYLAIVEVEDWAYNVVRVEGTSRVEVFYEKI